MHDSQNSVDRVTYVPELRDVGIGLSFTAW